MRFRKRPVEIEATPIELILAVGKDQPELLPEWVQKGIVSQNLRLYEEIVVVRTSEGNMRGEATDWLVQGTQGELYPVKDSIFKEIYEVVS